jgi:hypothetical protein
MSTKVPAEKVVRDIRQAPMTFPPLICPVSVTPCH